MKIKRLNKLNLKKPPINQFCRDNETITITKGRFITHCTPSETTVVDVKKDILDCCFFDDKIFIISKKGELFKVTNKTAEQIKINLNSSAISHNKTNLLIGTHEGKITVLSDGFKLMKSFFLLTESISRMKMAYNNKLIVSCVNSTKLYVLNLKKNEKQTINLQKGTVTAFDVFNKKFVAVGTESGYVSLVSLEENKEVGSIQVDHPVSFIRSSPSCLFVGTSSGFLLCCEVLSHEIKIIHKEQVVGVVNGGINIEGDNISVLCGREEARGAFYKNKNFKNAVIKFKICFEEN